MINKDCGGFTLVCDICGEEAPYTLTGLAGIAKYRQESRWKRQQDKGQWIDVCPECGDAGW